MDLEDHLHEYLKVRRSNLLAKLDGLSEHDARRPMTPRGTNLAGIVKHVAGVEVGYFGEVFGRPFPRPLPWFDDDDAEPDADFWLPEDQTVADVVELHTRTRRTATRRSRRCRSTLLGSCRGGSRSGGR